jgi:hypothetical protein
MYTFLQPSFIPLLLGLFYMYLYWLGVRLEGRQLSVTLPSTGPLRIPELANALQRALLSVLEPTTFRMRLSRRYPFYS